MRIRLVFLATLLMLAAQVPGALPLTTQLERRESYWPNGQVRASGTYLNDVRHGEYRTFRANGTPYELRHYDRGRESGLQQSWEEDGSLFLNYEVRNGRRYGFVNATPCLPANHEGLSILKGAP